MHQEVYPPVVLVDEDPELAAIRARLMQELQATAAAPAAEAPANLTRPVDVSDQGFDRFVLGHDAVLVDLWAPWCGPCRMVAPILEEVAAERAGRLAIAKVNVDDNPHVSQRFQVQGIPTMLLFKGGRLVDRVTGAMPKASLDAWLDRFGI